MERVKYGMPQLLELDSIEENVQLCSDLGLDFVELNLNLPKCQPDALNVQYLNLLKLNYDIEFTLHLPEDLDIGHFNRHIREAHLKIIEESIGVADRLGIKVLNLHMNKGIHFTLPLEKVELYSAYKKEYLNNIKSSKEAIEEYLEGTSVLLAIENTGLLDRDYIQQATKLLLENERFILTWDVGHDHIYNHNDRSFILDHLDRVKHVHLHDAVGMNDHLELGKGEINLGEKMKVIKSNGASVVVEVKTKEALVKSIAKLTNI